MCWTWSRPTGTRGVEHQDVGGHENGVAEQAHGHAVVGLGALGLVGVHRGLVGVGAVHLALGGHAGQQPVQLGDLGDVALRVEGHALGVEAGGQPGGGDFQARAGDARRVVALDEGVVVGQEEEALDARLAAGRDGRADGADVVAEVGGAGGGDAGEDALVHPLILGVVGLGWGGRGLVHGLSNGLGARGACSGTTLAGHHQASPMSPLEHPPGGCRAMTPRMGPAQAPLAPIPRQTVAGGEGRRATRCVALLPPTPPQCAVVPARWVRSV